MSISDIAIKVRNEMDNNLEDKKGTKNNKKVSATLEVLKDKINNFKSSEELKNLLRIYSQFHTYSASNKQLIYIQTLGQATWVAGYRTWEKLGRNVKGEKGLRILAPSYFYKKVEKKDDQGNVILNNKGKPVLEKEKIQYFRPVYIFDISQTEGKPLPELNRTIKEDISELQKPLLKLAHDGNIEVEFKNSRQDLILAGDINESEAKGYSSLGKIVINTKESPSNQTAIMIHEIAHEKLHKGEDRDKLTKEQKEIEADAVKFVVLDKYGIDSKSEKYLALYQKDYDIMNSLERIADTSKEIINEIETYMDIKLEKIKMEEKIDIKDSLKEQLSVIDKSLNKVSSTDKSYSSLIEQKDKIIEKIKLLDNDGTIVDKASKLNKKLKEYTNIKNTYTKEKSTHISR